MNNQPLVSILINNYNYGHFLGEAIDSALNQTYSNIEVIVVDDGSTDNSREIIQSYNSKVIPIFKANGGQASAFNEGFATSSGEIICFLDSDDIFQPEKVTEIVQVFAQYPKIGWCFHPLKFLSTNREDLPKENYSGSSEIYDLRTFIQQGKLKGKLPFGTATSGLCFNRSLLKQILPMPEAIRITSDDYIKYLALGLEPGAILLKEIAIQRIHGNNAYTFRKDKVNLKIQIQILTAYWIKTNFPQLQKFSNNILALGLYLDWRYGGNQEANNQLVKTYLSSTSLTEIIEIYLRAIYYSIKQ
ncbi:glycosyltransferase family 2 protein [Aerosakkonemataceae cyanobacterium BLCC-F154]|uniref:Glycosyltransferase family 2 protein n=1 Tax=Floridaenema fluviatile BLCC-F154 TaxID=3153640 RepID=A0ABV4YIS8_9CYAN